ncbi:hypothetical protein [Gabonibacter chumensis]|uniref:golvesin C-terminal-like domain-containing protein n=1 Tax=Gabonibacter chumensis TaxID=2972474 RepID=UPI002573900E|nr:hypothetical protein [Gabonibacter chumensis]MCR9012059.1 hypothetical protein [Gabonibacter chumensis]
MNFRHIGLIANYEMRTLSRVWGFKMVTVLSVLIVTFLHVITQSNLFEPEWIAISLPSAIPYANVYLVNSLQSIIIIFFAGNFLRESHYDGANSVLSARPYSNVELVWGNTTGFLILMLGFTLFLGAIAILIHLFGSDSPFAIYPYIFYFITLTCPVLFFFTGLTICVKGIVRNSALACIILLGLLLFFLNFGSELFYGVFDILAITLPNSFSDITGFTGLGSYLLQRSFFLVSGCGLIVLGVSFVHRLPSDSKNNFAAGKWGIGLLILGFILSGIYTSNMIRHNRERKIIHKVFVKYQATPKVSVLDHDIEFKQEGYTYSASSKLNLLNINDQQVDSIILYLNPSLNVIKITSGGVTLDFHREYQVLILSLAMKPGETREIEMSYKGSISPAVCYPEVTNIDSLAKEHHYYMYNMGQNYFYLQPDYTLLTPESMWYPTSKPSVHVDLPYLSDQDYTRFKLLVKGNIDGMVIAQGEEIKNTENTYFVNKVALPGLTLCIGDYTRKSIRKDSVLYEIFLFKGHEYLLPKEITPEEAVKSWTSMFGYNNKVYAFTKLNLVETPIHFCTFSRNWKSNSERVQPEIIFRPEREALYPLTFNIKSKWYDDEYPIDRFLSWYMKILTSSKQEIPLGNMFFNRITGIYDTKNIKNESDIYYLQQKYHYNVYSSSPEFVGINLLFHYMQHGFNTNFKDGIDIYYIAKCLKDRSLKEVSHDPDNKIDIDNAIFARGYYFLKYILCTVSHDKFKHFNSEFIRNHVFQSFSYEEYCEEFEKQFNLSLAILTRKLYNERGFPAFDFRDARVDDVESLEGKTGYVFSIKVWNKGKRDGILSLKPVASMEERNYFIPVGSCKEIKMYIEGNSDRCAIELYTNESQNLPSHYTLEKFPEKGFVKEPVDGIFGADTLAFAPEPSVYIVDNEDPGCRIVEYDRFVEKLRKKNSATRWHWLDDEDAYGEISKTYLKKATGKGSSDIEWEVNLPENGAYELFIYNPLTESKNQLSKGKKGETSVQSYHFLHATGKEKVEVALSDVKHGWVSLGIYQFHSGKARIILSGQGTTLHQLMYADAVKWVKVK